jgi:hypothetical protein
LQAWQQTANGSSVKRGNSTRKTAIGQSPWLPPRLPKKRGSPPRHKEEAGRLRRLKRGVQSCAACQPLQSSLALVTGVLFGGEEINWK